MKKIILITLLLYTTINSYSQISKEFYNRIFGIKRVLSNDIDTQIQDSILAYINSEGETLTSNEISYIKYKGSFNIINYGKVDLIELHLNNYAPAVLNRNFLLIINHQKKEISKYNVDNYSLLRKKDTDTSVCIGIVNTFRGNLQFFLLNYYRNDFKRDNIVDIFDANDCNQYEYGTLSVGNADLDNDGFLDIEFDFIKLIYCDNDGGSYNNIIYKKNMNIKLFLRNNIYLQR